MADGFIQSFISRLQKESHNPICLAQNMQSLEVGSIYVCEKSTALFINKALLQFDVHEGPSHSFNPDINLLFNSFVPLCTGIEILSVILTGIGDDGVQACTSLNEQGARCITETSKSAIIDGMPSRARELVPNVEAYDMETIVKKISEFCQ